MVNPTTFFAPDFFDTRDVTLPRLEQYARAVIQRLNLDNPGGVFLPLVTDLTKFYEDLFGSLTAADAGTSQRRGSAQLMWGALADLQHQLEADEDLIAYKSKKTPAIRTDLSPNGRKEYGQASLLTADLLLERASKAAIAHAKTLGPDFDPSRYQSFYDTFKEARDGTGAGDEQNARARAAAQGHRAALTDATKLVAAQFLRDEPRCAAYFPTGLLQAPAPDKKKAAPTA
jgi:hypothetical protein